MGLITSYSDDNKVTEQKLAVSYSKRRIPGVWSYVDGTTVVTVYEAWECHRYATKVFKYIGMEKEAAEDCAEDMVELFTRDYKYSEFDSDSKKFIDSSGGSKCMADISITNINGCMYEVTVSVNEDDSRLRLPKDFAGSPKSLFASENARDYKD